MWYFYDRHAYIYELYASRECAGCVYLLSIKDEIETYKKK